MGSGTIILGRQLSARIDPRQRFCCGAARARSPVTTYPDASGARTPQQQQALLQPQSKGLTQHFQQDQSGQHEDLASIRLDHDSVVPLLNPHDGQHACCSSSVEAHQPRGLIPGNSSPTVLLPPSATTHDQVPDLPGVELQRHPDHHHQRRHHALAGSGRGSQPPANGRSGASWHSPGPPALAVPQHLTSYDLGHQSAVGADAVDGDRRLPFLDPVSRSGGEASTSQPADVAGLYGAGERWRGQRGGAPGPRRAAHRPPERAKAGTPAAAGVAAAAATATAVVGVAEAASGTPGLRPRMDSAGAGAKCNNSDFVGSAREEESSGDDGSGVWNVREESSLVAAGDAAAPGLESVSSGDIDADSLAAEVLQAPWSGSYEVSDLDYDLEAHDSIPDTDLVPASATADVWEEEATGSGAPGRGTSSMPKRRKPPSLAKQQERQLHELLRQRAAARHEALTPREPTAEDLRLTTRVVNATHWRSVLALVSEHKERHERCLAEEYQARQLQPQPQHQLHPQEQTQQHPEQQDGLGPSAQASSEQEHQYQLRAPSSGTAQPPQQAELQFIQQQQPETEGRQAFAGRGPPRPSLVQPDPHGPGPGPGPGAGHAAPPGFRGPPMLRPVPPCSSRAPPPVPIALLPFTPQHVAVILLRTLQLLCVHGGPTSRAEALQLQAMVEGLARLAGVMLGSPAMGMREIVVIFYSLVRMRRPLGNAYLLSLMAAARKRFTSRPPRPPLQRKGHKKGAPSPSAPRQRQPLPYSGCHMALLIWSISRCGFKALRADYAKALYAALRRVVPELTGQGVAITLYGMARMHASPPKHLAAALCARLVALTGHGSGGGCCGTGDGRQHTTEAEAGSGGGARGVRCAPAAFAAAATSGDAAGPAGLQGVTAEGGQEAAAAQGRKRRKGQKQGRTSLGEAEAQPLLVVGEAGLATGIDPEGLLQALDYGGPESTTAASAHGGAHAAGSDGSGSPAAPDAATGSEAPVSSAPRRCRPADVSMTLWALAALGLPPDSVCPDLLPAVLGYSQAHMLDFPEQELSNLVWALARLQHTPPPDWIQSLYDAVHAQLPYLGPQALATVLYGLEQMGQRPAQEWLRDVAERVRFLLPWSAPQSMALAVHALVVLGFRPERPWLAAFHERLEAHRGQLDNRVRDKVRTAYQLLGFRPGPQQQPQQQPAAGGRNGAAAGPGRGVGSWPAEAQAERRGAVTLPAAPSRWGSSAAAGAVARAVGSGGPGSGGQRWQAAAQGSRAGGRAGQVQLQAQEQARARAQLGEPEQAESWADSLEDVDEGSEGGWDGAGLARADDVATPVLVRPSRFV